MPIYRAAIQAKNNRNFTFDTLVFPGNLKSDGQDCNFKGLSQEGNWKPIEFQWFGESDNNTDQKLPEREKGNFAHVFAGGLKIAGDAKVKEALAPVFGKDVEFLPIKIQGDSSFWYLLNVVHIVHNALSLENSKFKIRSNGSIGRLTKAVFDLNNIPDNRVFIYPQWPNDFMVKGDVIKRKVLESGLTGISFDEYDSI